MSRYRLIQDNDCHWYMVDADEVSKLESILDDICDGYGGPDSHELEWLANKGIDSPCHITFEMPEFV